MTDILSSYLTGISRALHGKDGAQLAALIALPRAFISRSSPSTNDLTLATQAKTVPDILRHCYKILQVDQAVADAVGQRLQCLCELSVADYDAAYKAMHSAFNNLLDFMGTNVDFPFLASALARLASDLRVVAVLADSSKVERERMSSPCLRECQNAITRAFTLVAKDRLPVTDPQCKKRSIFSITNTLFKIYFRLNTLQLMGKLIKLVDTPSVMNHLKAFPLCDVVTYKFYVGRLSMFEDRLEEARESLRFALRFTPPKQTHNRQLILASLVPIEMCQGIMPTAVLGSRYGLHELADLGRAVVTGNLRLFNQLFESNKAVYIRLGVYLVLEQLKTIVYRNLFKRIYTIADNTRLSVSTFQQVLLWLGEEVDLDEIECILSNLIFQNKVKGYLSHQKRVLVIGKNDPFPSASIIKRVKVDN